MPRADEFSRSPGCRLPAWPDAPVRSKRQRRARARGRQTPQTGRTRAPARPPRQELVWKCDRRRVAAVQAPVNSSAQAGGRRSSRVESIWPSLTKVGPVSSSNAQGLTRCCGFKMGDVASFSPLQNLSGALEQSVAHAGATHKIIRVLCRMRTELISRRRGRSRAPLNTAQVKGKPISPLHVSARSPSASATPASTPLARSAIRMLCAAHRLRSPEVALSPMRPANSPIMPATTRAGLGAHR